MRRGMRSMPMATGMRDSLKLPGRVPVEPPPAAAATPTEEVPGGTTVEADPVGRGADVAAVAAAAAPAVWPPP